MSNTINVAWQEDGSATVYARLMARDATGTAIVGQGKCLKQADLSSITYSVYDDEETGTSAVASGTVTIASSIFDTLKLTADDPVWTFTRGFNFRHDLGPECFPTGDHVYMVEYRITTAGGAVGWARFRGKAESERTS